MSSFDKKANEVFEELDLCNRIFYRKCEFVNENGYLNGYKCPMCDTYLEYTYLENRLYAIRCDGCDFIRLVKGSSPVIASRKVGILYVK